MDAWISRAIVTALIAAIAIAAPASVASAMQCGTRLVLEGDSAAHTRAACGEPSSRETRIETRNEVVGIGTDGETYWSTVAVEIQIWIYDFGPRRSMQEITVADGVVRTIRALGRGTDPLRR